MWVLGIESSCDETAAAVLGPGGTVHSSVVHSQDALHADYGGVVPELASREHLEKIQPVVCRALEQAGMSLKQMEGIAVTCGPGLVGSLLVGLSFAKSLAMVRGLPIVGVNHLEGHLLAPFVGHPEAVFPFVGLIVSGGHTCLYLAPDFGRYQLLGSTRDDAAGEAFDKVAKLMSLGYPGGPRVDALAKEGNSSAIRFPRGMLRQGGFDFSFSGLKTAVLNHVRGAGRGDKPADIAASFQEAVVDVLARKTMKAVRKHGVKRLVVSGGVSANGVLRARFHRECLHEGVSLKIPPMQYCTDNAAMIAWVGRQRLMRGQRDGLEIRVKPRWGLSSAEQHSR